MDEDRLHFYEGTKEAADRNGCVVDFGSIRRVVRCYFYLSIYWCGVKSGDDSYNTISE